MKSKVFFIFLLLGFNLFSQDKTTTENQQEAYLHYYYKNEWSLGASLYTNGSGLDFRSGQFRNIRLKRTWEVGFNTVKHPKEYKQWTAVQFKTFVYGKLNECYNLYAGRGKLRTLYMRRDLSNVEIKFAYFYGFSMALLKPIYYIVYKDGNEVIETYQPYHQPGTIYGKAAFIYGMDEIKFDPGIYGKVIFNFDFAKSYKTVSALEVGAMGALYLKELEIMAETKNYNYFVALFLSYRFGQIYKGKFKQIQND